MPGFWIHACGLKSITTRDEAYHISSTTALSLIYN